MKMNQRWMMILVLLFLGTVMMISGCAPRQTVMSYNEAKETFQRATIIDAKKCAPCQYATAEAWLAMADHEMKYYWREMEHLERSTKIVKEKSLEAISLTPCEEKPAPPPPKPPAPTPTPPPPPPKPPVLDTIYFDPAKSNINPAAAKALDRNGMILKENPQLKVEIGGHTDASGSDEANQAISEKRAQSAKKYLQDKFNISEDRLKVKGYGTIKPIADNSTQEGRSKNRRVEFIVIP